MATVTRKIGTNARGHKQRKGNQYASEHWHVDEDAADRVSRNEKKDKLSVRDSLSDVGASSLLFLGEKHRAKGLKKQFRDLSEHADMKVSSAEYEMFRKTRRLNDPGHSHFASIQSALSRSIMSEQLWLSLFNRNLLLYGIGTKSSLLQQLAMDVLCKGEDVIEIRGNHGRYPSSAGNKTVAMLLNTIAKTVLRAKDAGRQFDDCLSFKASMISRLLDRHYKRDISSSLGCADFVLSHNLLGSDSTILGNEDHTSKVGSLSNTGGRSSSRSSSNHDNTNIGSFEAASIAALKFDRYSRAQSKLYIVIHDLDGPGLSSEESQSILSILAECSSVTFIASMNAIHTPAMWSADNLASFRWLYVDAATYLPHIIPQPKGSSSSSGPSSGLTGGSGGTSSNGTNFPLVSRERERRRGGGGGSASSLEHLLLSLTDRHKDLLALIFSLAVGNGDAGDISSNGNSNGNEKSDPTRATVHIVPKDHVRQATLNSLTASNESTLSLLLKEFIDHRVITVTTDVQKREFLNLHVDYATMQAFLAKS